jgi:hypothetical protein
MCQGKRVGEFNHKGVAYTSALLAGNPSPEHHHLSRYKGIYFVEVYIYGTCM